MTKKEHKEIINDIKNQIEEKAYQTNNNIEAYFVDFHGLATLEELHTIVKDLSFCTTGIHPWRDTFDKMERMLEDIKEEIQDLKYDTITEVQEFLNDINV